LAEDEAQQQAGGEMLAGTLEIGELQQMHGGSLQPGSSAGEAAVVGPVVVEPGTLEIEELKQLED
jgi:hypothetical protein